MAKHRTSIPKEVAARARFLSHDTCCVCREREKEIQIHHINEDPSNHDVENLAVLCLECHAKTQKKGSFTRNLDAPFVTLCRDQWLKEVSLRWDLAREKYVERQVGNSPEISKDAGILREKSISFLLPIKCSS